MKIDIRKLNIALARKSMNTSDLAKNTGLSLDTIRQYVRGNRIPTTKSLGKIAKALECDVTDIIE